MLIRAYISQSQHIAEAQGGRRKQEDMLLCIYGPQMSLIRGLGSKVTE